MSENKTNTSVHFIIKYPADIFQLLNGVQGDISYNIL